MSDDYVYLSVAMDLTGLSFAQIIERKVPIFYMFQRIKQETQSKVSDPDKYDWNGYFNRVSDDLEKGEGFFKGENISFKEASCVPASKRFINTLCQQNIESQSAVVDFLFLENRDQECNDYLTIQSSGAVPSNVYVPFDALRVRDKDLFSLMVKIGLVGSTDSAEREKLRNRAVLMAQVKRDSFRNYREVIAEGHGEMWRNESEKEEKYCPRLAKIEIVINHDLDNELSKEKGKIDKEIKDRLVEELDWIKRFRLGEHNGYKNEVNVMKNTSTREVDGKKDQASQSKHFPKQILQEKTIRECLLGGGYQLLSLPMYKAGKPSAKAYCKERLLENKSLFSVKSFDKAWERLMSSKEIAYRQDT